MSTLTTILLIIWIFYLLNSFVNNNWNDFFYAVCVLWVCVMELPSWLEICAIIILIITHRFIKVKEQEN
jgi:hypothetical protein